MTALARKNGLIGPAEKQKDAQEEVGRQRQPPPLRRMLSRGPGRALLGLQSSRRW